MHRKGNGNEIVIHTELCMTKTYNNMDTYITGFNQLVSYNNMDKHTTGLNQLVKMMNFTCSDYVQRDIIND